jgi:environmental stress-induced protein Ves
MIILRASSYRTVAWKNGGGMTREILREPAEPTPFDWRLSLATIDSSGPFSAFAGYHRTLVLVSGAGVELDFGQQERARLTVPGQVVAFDGAWPTSCTLLDGRSTDLNLIVSQERMRFSSECLQLTQPRLLQTAQWPQTLVCCISGAVRLTDGTGRTEELGSVDVARSSADDGAITCNPLGSAPARIFVAGLGPRQA